MEFLEFKGNWRNYQDRVLRKADYYLQDGKVHIVAAPGSGKTTLGIELIARIGEPTLILAPSIVIRQQWEQRIIDAFLVEGIEPGDYISQDLKNPSVITIATYQALHSAMTKFAGKLEEQASDEDTDDKDEAFIEEVDYSDYDLIQNLKKLGVKAICLDECHHLRSEWWKALEDFKEAMGNMKTIALTATPPYDSTPAMWERYINMCGEIDEEITIPELVKEGSLCPHQDYVYFNYPTKEENKAISAFYDKAKELVDSLIGDADLQEGVWAHSFLTGTESDDVILEEPSYLASLLIYLNQCNKPFPKRFLALLGVKKLPEMDGKWMEILLQKLIFEDSERFACNKDFIETLQSRLKADGLIERRKVVLSKNSLIEKTLINSKGKADSIVTIAKSEYKALGENLRMVVLTDYIRKEYLKNLGGDESEEILMLGVLPFFEKLRREFEKSNNPPSLGVLCGSIVIIPASAKDAVCDAADDPEKISFSSVGNISENEYLQVNVSGDRRSLTSIITTVFGQGYIQILIGTKSLLGEGWDSPCINSLILASFVGSFMLSNQMRGRAIRIVKDNPEKTSNIWHLVCLNPTTGVAQGLQGDFLPSEDLFMLERRMEHFLGLHYTEDTIESGMDRLSVIETPLNKNKVKNINKEMLEMSVERELLKDRWQKALAVIEQPEIIAQRDVPNNIIPVALFYEALPDLIIAIILTVFESSFYTRLGDSPLVLLLYILIIVAIAYYMRGGIKLFKSLTPYGRLKAISKAILSALEEQDLIEDVRCKAVVIDESRTLHGAYLEGGSTRDKELFAKCVSEFFGVIDNQRYILVRQNHLDGANAYYAVPEVFAKKKESAEKFAKFMKKSLGKYELFYTRNPEGRALLLKARAKAFANKNDRLISHKKVKSALE